MKQLKNGFILPAVFIFLQIFSLLGLYGMSVLTRMSQLLFQQEQSDTHLRIGLEILAALETSDIKTACIIPVMFTSNLSQQPLIWWQEKACHDTLQNNQYYYVIESLGIDECGITNPGFVADYYRISVLLPNDSVTRLILQSVVAKPVQTTLVCQVQTHRVTIGRQVWREIQ